MGFAEAEKRRAKPWVENSGETLYNGIVLPEDWPPDTVDPAKVKPRPLDEIRPGGLGTYFIQRIMDEFRFTVPESGKGNLLIMKKRLDKANEAPSHEL